ncbi:MAG: methyltransferase domain-containing protein, partial [Actinomycetota bacterium]
MKIARICLASPGTNQRRITRVERLVPKWSGSGADGRSGRSAGPRVAPRAAETTYSRPLMDAKELNAIVHDREAAFYDDRFLISYDGRIGRDVERDLRRVIGEPVKARRALDLACGTGYAAIGLAAAGLAEEVHASDLSIEMLRRCRDNTHSTGAEVRLALADAEKLPYVDGVFDLIVARGALHHVPSPLEALREVRRVLEPGGVAVVLAEPTAPGEKQVAAVVGTAYRAVEAWR